jgi:CRISPR/Cas system CSM-associated protein Csm2 small subunit
MESRGGGIMLDSPDEIQWHPAFCAAAGLEFQENLEDLEFTPEYNLSKEPIRIDLLIQKDGAGAIKNEIGHIMKKYNIIEYKSPKDGISIDDFAKTIGYALLLKGYGKTVNQYPMEELTVSMFRAVHPRELFAELKREGHEIEKKYPGIYYIRRHLLFPVQIVVTKELSPETHSSLRILTDDAEIEDVRRFLEQASKLKNPGDRDNIDAVLQASVAANFGLYEDVRRDSIMCQALQELMKDEIEEKVNNAETETQVKNIRNLMKNFKCTVEQAMDALEIPQQKREIYLSKL